jgi:hypothetical protein
MVLSREVFGGAFSSSSKTSSTVAACLLRRGGSIGPFLEVDGLELVELNLFDPELDVLGLGIVPRDGVEPTEVMN